MKPLVSIIIPTYGGHTSLKHAVDSALQQVYPNFEVIVVDDNDPNTDARKRTAMIMSKYDGVQNLKYICHDRNRNGSAARNTGAKNSSGEYLTFLDDDDMFLPGKILKQAEYLSQNEKYDAVYCWRYEDDKVVSSELTGNLSESLLDLSFTPCTPAIMIRRNCFDDLCGFDESYTRHQDFEFLLRFYKRFAIGVVKEPLIKIIGNDVDNQVKGKEAVEIKRKFMNAFSGEINEIETKNKGFKKRVYANHYSVIFIKLIRYGNILLAIKVLFTDAYKGGALFWKRVAEQIREIVAKRLKQLIA